MSAATFLPPPPNALEKPLPQHHRRDVWSRIANGRKVPTRKVTSAANPSRRERCRFDLMAFGLEYFPHRIRDPQPAHRELVGDLQRAILSKQSIVPTLHAEADPRGFGKTTWVEIAIIHAACYGHRVFLLFLSATGPNADARLKAIAAEIIGNERLAEDFPELVLWLRETHGGDPRRAPPDFPWSGSVLRLPNWVIIEARGMDSSLTGINRFGRRPDFVVMDDVETLDIASSENEMRHLENRIKLEVLQVHERGRPAAYFFINTIRRPNCIAQRLTDPKVSPQWRGRRRAALVKEPERKDLWDRFLELAGTNPATPAEADALAGELETAAAIGIEAAGFSELEEPARNALRFYAAHQAEMDKGAELLDPLRMPLWYIYLERAKDETAFQCELQNNPPEDANQRTTILEVEHILARRIGPERGVVPAWAEFLVLAVDVAQARLHWELDAFDAGGLNQLVDQGIQETNLDAGGEYQMLDKGDVRREAMVDRAIEFALSELHAKALAGWADARGHLHFPALIGVDSGGTAETFAWYETILRWCAKTPRWIPLKGQQWSGSTADHALGKNWICRTENNPGRRVDANADHYKLRLSRAYELPALTKGELTPGARILHAGTPHAYAKHQTSERYIESINPKAMVGKDVKVGWNKIPGQPNHWWDTAWMAFALAEIWPVMRAIELQRVQNAQRRPSAPSQLPGWVQRERF